MSEETLENKTDVDKVETSEVTEVTESTDESADVEKPAGTKPGKFPAWLTVVIIVILIGSVGGFFQLKDAQENHNRAKARLSQGQAALLDNDTYKALFEYSQALEYDPEIQGAHLALGRIAIINKQGDDAVRHFLSELEINPFNRDARLALGCIYSLGCVPSSDPHQVNSYLLSRFDDVLPYAWPDEFSFAGNPDIDALTEAVTHFHLALENLPGDPAPAIGLALTDIATDNLNGARSRLSRLTSLVSDESYLPVIQSIIEDINREEQFRQTSTAMASQRLPDITSPLLDNPVDETSEPLTVDSPFSLDLSGELGALPPIPEQAAGGMFGSRDPLPFALGDDGEIVNNFGTQLTREDIAPQPSVRPISRDIFLAESNEVMKTVRLANMYQAGDIAFRIGELVIMPQSGTEVTVLAQTDDVLLIQERGYVFKFKKGSVGWDLVEDENESIFPDDGIPEGITVHDPEDAVDESDTEEELGPEIENG